MFLGGLPGGSPGPDAIGTWTTLIVAIVFAIAAGLLLLWLLFSAAWQIEQGSVLG